MAITFHAMKVRPSKKGLMIVHSVSYILGELWDNTASVGTKTNYPGDLVHLIFFRNKALKRKV